jgi:hypothetical protein
VHSHPAEPELVVLGGGLLQDGQPHLAPGEGQARGAGRGRGGGRVGVQGWDAGWLVGGDGVRELQMQGRVIGGGIMSLNCLDAWAKQCSASTAGNPWRWGPHQIMHGPQHCRMTNTQGPVRSSAVRFSAAMRRASLWVRADGHALRVQLAGGGLVLRVHHHLLAGAARLAGNTHLGRRSRGGGGGRGRVAGALMLAASTRMRASALIVDARKPSRRCCPVGGSRTAPAS